MHQPGSLPASRLSQHSDGFGIHPASHRLISFSLVHCGVCRSVDDDLRLHLFDQSSKALRLGEVRPAAVVDTQRPQGRERTLQLPAHLAVGSQ
ncbi:hypothetical protein D3C78_1537170 [compost metagenome]